MISEELQKKIDASIRLLQSVAKSYDGIIEVAYSGGKDSDVILQLAKEAGIRYEAIYKNTTIDPPGTIAHVKENGVKIIRPSKTFFHLIAEKGLPNRRMRFCCSCLKEYKIHNKVVIGVRRAESRARSQRYSEPTECRWYGAKKTENHVEQIYPILDWTDDDVKTFIIDRCIKLAPIYYISKGGGGINIKQRLGCMGCPLMSHKKRIASFKQYPNMVKAYLRAAQKYLELHPNSKSAQKYANAYEFFARNVLSQSTSEWNDANNGLFCKPNYKELIEKTFNVKL